MRAEVRDACYWYEIYGSGEAVVLLHGFTGSTKTWSNFITKYQEKFKIIVIDLPGHGKTNTPTPVTIEQCCHDIHQILEGNDIKSYHLVGYSMGGRTALTYAMYYQEELKSLILESASPGLEIESEREKRIINDEKLAFKIELEGITSFIDYWENIPLFHTQKCLPDHTQKELRQERLSHAAEGLALSLRGMGTGSMPSWWEHLSSIEIPVLLMVGALDTKFMEINRRMKNYIPNCILKRVEKAGHAIHVESQAIFGKMVEEFIISNSNI